jgi:hypothetical protein
MADSPRLLPITVALSVLVWVIATNGGSHVFVKEWLGEAYDSQAEHFLQGDVGVDVRAISSEAMIVNGKVRMYFGPFPALLRIPLNFAYPEGRGRWSRISGFCAGLVALFGFAGLLSTALRQSALSPQARTLIGGACLSGFVFGSPLLFLLGNLSIYNEAVIWGLAWSVAALHFAFRSRETEGSALTRSALGFSLCASGALLSRATFGAPFVPIAALFALTLPRERRLVNLTALLLPLAAGVLFYLLLNYAKCGSFTGTTYVFYINGPHHEWLRRHGVFNLSRVPYGFEDYFSLLLPSLHLQPPFVRVDRHPLPISAPFPVPLSEVFLSLPWCSGWLVFGAILGIVCLVLPKQADYFERCVAAALLAEFLGILSYFALAQRYAADLCPFLIFCLVVFLRTGGIALLRVRYLLVGLIAFSVAVNLLGTAYWLANDANLPTETRSFGSAIAGVKIQLLK